MQKKASSFDELWDRVYSQYQEDAAIELGHNPQAKPGDEEATAWFRNTKNGQYDIPSSENYIKTVANQLKMGPTPLPQDFVAFLNSAVKQFGPQMPDVIVYDQLDQKTINNINSRFPNFFITSVVQIKDHNTGKPVGVWGVFKPSSNATAAYDNTRVMKRLDTMKEAGGPLSIGNSFLGSLYGAAGNMITKGVGKLFNKDASKPTTPVSPQPQQVSTAQQTDNPASPNRPGISVQGVTAGPEEYQKVDQLVQALIKTFGSQPKKEDLSSEAREFIKAYGLEKMFEADLRSGLQSVQTFLRTLQGKGSSQKWGLQDFQNLSTLLDDPDVQALLKQKKIVSNLNKADFQILIQTVEQKTGKDQGNKQNQAIKTSSDPRVVAAGYTDLFKKLAMDPKAKGEAVNLWRANHQSTDLTTWSVNDLKTIDNLAATFLGPNMVINANLVKNSENPSLTLGGKQVQSAPVPQATPGANKATVDAITKYMNTHKMIAADKEAFSRVLRLLKSN